MAYHLENPIRQPWTEVLSLMADSLGLKVTDSLPLKEWTAALRFSAKDLTQAMKLISFFENDFEFMASGSVIMDTYQSRKVSKTLRQMQPVKAQQVSTYVEYWLESGFLTGSH
jgi:hypothetical protein